MSVNFHNSEFAAAYGTSKQIPGGVLPEIAVCGRSNVGKSSLLNKLVGRKALAKVSSQPGRTANVNFFEVDGVAFVDLPGYGFARVSKAERKRWSNLIGGYFEQNRSFNLVVALVDIRLDAQQLDRQMLGFLQERELPFIVALTKADKLGRNKQLQQRASLARQFCIDPEAMVITSSQTGLGIDDIRRRIQRAVDDPEVPEGAEVVDAAPGEDLWQ